mmetsp:Transcript_173/g.208  ORF Transcript_173/g.208 Transcript_173/m.208 type:complete len:120 (-) Transcript_173:1188-1547(-)
MISSQRAKTRINSNGDVVSADENSDDNKNILNSNSSFDVFGFNLSMRQFLIGLGVLAFMIGLRGTLLVLLALGLYHVWSRSVNSNVGISSNASSSTSRRWGSTKQIKGVKDLPCDPKGG